MSRELIVSSYLDEHYVIATESGFGRMRPLFRVLVERDLQASHIDAQLGLPCCAAGSGRMRGEAP